MQVSPSGLVFYYDTFNNKSYKGQPTTNVAVNPLDLYAWCTSGANAATLARDTSTSLSPAGGIPMKMTTTAADPYTYTYNSSPWNLNAASQGQSWTMSVWAKANRNLTCELFLFEANSSGVYTNLSTSGISVTAGWQRFILSRTNTDATTAYVQVRLDGPNSYTAGDVVWWDGLQVEQKSYATQFAAGTRSVTNGLVDLVGNCTVNLNSSSFDSAANITFGGSNCITVDDTPAIALSGDKSFCMWIYFDQDASCGFGGKSNGTVSGMSLGYGWSGGGFMALAWNTANSPALAKDSRDYKKWVYLAAVQNGSTRYIYAVDAIGIRSTSSSGGTHSWSNSLPLKIGRINDHAQVPSGTKIGEVSVYNRALTQSEVLQNFNRSKSRYGL
jgi:hypothetical protein